MDYFSGFESKTFQTSDGVTIHYLQKGTGKPLILMPGWSASVDVYRMNAEVLSQKYTVYVYENRGHGRSQTPEYGYRISRLAKDAYEFQQSLGLEKANWVAHSMGCTVMWSMIDLFGQDHFDKLILVDEAPFLYGNPQETEEEVRLSGAQRIDLWQICNAFARSWEEGEAAFSRYWPTYIDPPFPEKSEESVDDPLTQQDSPPDTTTSPSGNRFLAKLLMDHITQDWRDLIPRINVPTLYISGDESFATTRECVQWIVDRIAGCQWVCVTGKGIGTHHMMQDSPDLFNRAIIDFVG